MRWVVGCTLAMLVLSGCAASSSSESASGIEGVEVQATKDTGVIRGVVTDIGVRPIVGALVTLSGNDQSTTTLENGAFGFQGLDPGTYFVKVAKAGFIPGQTGVEVVAGVSDPEVKRIQLEANPATAAFIEPYSYIGYLECGVAVFYTSVGCTILGPLAELTASEGIWNIPFNVLPNHTQGELIWEQTQQAGGELIWEVVDGGTNNYCGYRETTVSPALAYINQTVMASPTPCFESGVPVEGHFLENGVSYRFFGGPHPLCKLPNPNLPPPLPNNPVKFGCGVTLEQKTQAVVHNFYNMVPNPGWRFTTDGNHPLPR